MARTALQQDRSERRTDGGTDEDGRADRRSEGPAWTGPATVAVTSLSLVDRNEPEQQAEMTIAEFVEKVFVPEHVAMKKLSGRTHYHAILKHILTPEEVERVFEAAATSWKTRLRVAPNWPYLGAVRLCDARPDDVQRLISAALARGYSSQTVAHMRSVVRAIFEHAKRGQWFSGENPAGLVKLPRTTHKKAHALTLAQTKEVIERMQYPEKQVALIAVLTGMNVAEICGLQWKHVNLTQNWAKADGEPIPPRTVAVRRQCYRGELGGVNKQGRSRNLPIPDSLLSILLSLRRRADFARPDDFVIASRTGTPVDAKAVATRRLKPIGRELNIPWLSWRVFQRTRRRLLYELGIQFQSDPSFFANEEPGVAVEDSLPANVYADLVDRVNDVAERWMRYVRLCAAGGRC